MRLLERSATKTRPRESIATACGRLNSPGPLPFLPQALMKRPSFVYFTTRAFTCPSVTKMSPLAATATSVGPLNVYGPSPATPFVPMVIRSLVAGEFVDQLAVRPFLVVLAVGHPEIAVAVDANAMRPDEHLVAPRPQHLAIRVEFDD